MAFNFKNFSNIFKRNNQADKPASNSQEDLNFKNTDNQIEESVEEDIVVDKVDDKIEEKTSNQKFEKEEIKTKSFKQLQELWQNSKENSLERKEIWELLKTKAKTFDKRRSLWSHSLIDSLERKEAWELVKNTAKNFNQRQLLWQKTEDSTLEKAEAWEFVKAVATTFDKRRSLWSRAEEDSLEKAEAWELVKAKAITLGQIQWLVRNAKEGSPEKIEADELLKTKEAEMEINNQKIGNKDSQEEIVEKEIKDNNSEESVEKADNIEKVDDKVEINNEVVQERGEEKEAESNAEEKVSNKKLEEKENKSKSFEKLQKLWLEAKEGSSERAEAWELVKVAAKAYNEKALLWHNTIEGSSERAEAWKLVKAAAKTFGRKAFLWGETIEGSSERAEAWKLVKAAAKTFEQKMKLWYNAELSLEKAEAWELIRTATKTIAEYEILIKMTDEGSPERAEIEKLIAEKANNTEKVDDKQAPDTSEKSASPKDSESTEKEAGFTPQIKYREILEKIKIKEGNIEKSEYRNFEKVSKNFKEELESLTDSLVAEKLDKNLDANLEDLAKKTGLSLETIKEIYQTQEESLVAEAKERINKESSIFKKIGITAGKSAIYAGAGVLSATSAVASLGVGIGLSMGVIAGARMLDRVITEKHLKKKLSAKVAEVKLSKKAEDKEAISKRFAAAISLKKKMEIDKVDLEKAGKETKINIFAKYTSEYIEENSVIGSLKEKGIDPLSYKDNIMRSLKGLDDIDHLNNVEEEKLNKTGAFDKIKQIEAKLFGKSSKEKIVSTAVFIGLGMAARELPGVRRVMMAYAGYRTGALVGDYLAKRKEKKQAINHEVYSEEYFIDIRKKLLDHNFQKNEPEKYLELKEKLEEYENYLAKDGLEKIEKANEKFSSNLDIDKDRLYTANKKKIIIRAGGAVLGLLAGDMMAELARNFRNSSASQQNNLSSSGNLPQHNMPQTASNDLRPNKMPGSGPPLESKGLAHVQTADTNSATINTIGAKTAGLSSSTGADSLAMKPSGTASGATAGALNVAPKVAETPPIGQASSHNDHFSDLISNKDLKAGQHDSVWRSTDQIFKEHAKELGYKESDGDLNAWAQHQTGNALRQTQINMNAADSGKLTDKVFDGNTVNLVRDAKGHWVVHVEQAKGLTPGHLGHPIDNSIKEMPSKSLNKVSGLEKLSATDLRGSHGESPIAPGVNHPSTTDLGKSYDETPIYPGVPSPHKLGLDVINNSDGAGVPPVANHLAGFNASSIVKGGNESISSDPLSSIKGWSSLHDNTKILLGNLEVTKLNNNTFSFIRNNGEHFKVVINPDNHSGDIFNIKKAGLNTSRWSSLENVRETIKFKKLFYRHLPNKNSSLAQMLLDEIKSNRKLIRLAKKDEILTN